MKVQKGDIIYTLENKIHIEAFLLSGFVLVDDTEKTTEKPTRKTAKEK